jgi:hypothetical protein
MRRVASVSIALAIVSRMSSLLDMAGGWTHDLETGRLPRPSHGVDGVGMDDGPGPVPEFVAALQNVAATLTDVRRRLSDAKIADTAMGRLFEAQAVREAYHARLPLIEQDLDQAGALVGHIVADLHADRPAPPDAVAPAAIPGQSGGPES